MLLPKLAIDAEVSLCDITEELVRELALLEPTGMGNPAPMLKVEGSIVDWRIVGRQGNHLTFTMRDHHHEERRAIAFGLAEQAGGLVSCQENAAVAFVPVINEWREERTVQLQVRALARAGERSDFISRVMETYPWQLSPDYYLSSYLKKAVANLENKPSYEPAQIRISDLRRMEQAGSTQGKSVPWYISTALSALCCRSSRTLPRAAYCISREARSNRGLSMSI